MKEAIQNIIREFSVIAPAICLAGCFGCGEEESRQAVQEREGYSGAEEPAMLQPVGVDEYRAIIAGRRGDIIIVYFWATWCAPCVKSFPRLVEMHEKHAGKGVAIVGANVDFHGEEHKAEAFLKEQGAKFTNLSVKPGDMHEFITSVNRSWSGDIPAAFIYDRAGGLAEQRFGEDAVASVEEILLEMLDENL